MYLVIVVSLTTLL